MKTQNSAARLTEGPVSGHLVRLTVPMIWGLLAVMTFSVADTYFVGRLGTAELAAMSFTFPVVMVLISVSIGLGAGTSSVVARAIGRGDRDRVRRLTTDSLVLSVLVVGMLTVLGAFTIDPLFLALGAGPDLLPLVRDYMLIWYLGIVFLIVPMVGMSAIRATGEARIPALIMAGAALINIALDPLLIFGLAGFPRLELQGAAVATVISRALTFVATLWVLHYRQGMLSFERPDLAAVVGSWRSILHVGLPAAGTNAVIPLATGIIVVMIAAHGPAAVAGFGAATRVESLTLVVFYAMSSIIGPFVGQNLGAGQRDRIRQAMRQIMIFCFGLGAAIALILWALAVPTAALFSDAPEVVAVAAAYLIIVPVSFGGAGVIMIANAAFNGLGLPGKAVAVSLLRMFAITLPAAYLGARVFGVAGIFGAISLANLAIGVGAYLWFQRACARFAPQVAGAP